jgi:broad specificity phosphatase PhoE
MPKRMKFERQLAKAAKRMPVAPPSPAESAALAAQGIDLNRGNSNLQELAPEGHQEAQEVGEALADKGGLDELKSSGSVRANETAQDIAATGAAPAPTLDGDMQSMAMGNLEGQPQALVRDQIKNLIRNNPSAKIPGKGALSTRPGESFDDFRNSRLSAVRGLMQELANDPTKKLGRVTHSQVIKLTKAWLANGAPDDFSIKPDEMTDQSEAPGSVVRLWPNDKGEWELNDVNMDDKSPLPPGGYLIRHGMTPWNKETYDNRGDDQQAAIQQIAKYTRSMDFGRALATAQKASKAGHLTDDEIQGAVDSAIPDPEDAADLPMHQVLALGTAASPSKGYTPLLQKYFGDHLGDLPPEAQAPLAAHLQQLGINS